MDESENLYEKAFQYSRKLFIEKQTQLEIAKTRREEKTFQHAVHFPVGGSSPEEKKLLIEAGVNGQHPKLRAVRIEFYKRAFRDLIAHGIQEIVLIGGDAGRAKELWKLALQASGEYANWKLMGHTPKTLKKIHVVNPCPHQLRKGEWHHNGCGVFCHKKKIQQWRDKCEKSFGAIFCHSLYYFSEKELVDTVNRFAITKTIHHPFNLVLKATGWVDVENEMKYLIAKEKDEYVVHCYVGLQGYHHSAMTYLNMTQYRSINHPCTAVTKHVLTNSVQLIMEYSDFVVCDRDKLSLSIPFDTAILEGRDFSNAKVNNKVTSVRNSINTAAYVDWNKYHKAQTIAKLGQGTVKNCKNAMRAVNFSDVAPPAQAVIATSIVDSSLAFTLSINNALNKINLIAKIQNLGQSLKISFLKYWMIVLIALFSVIAAGAGIGADVAHPARGLTAVLFTIPTIALVIFVVIKWLRVAPISAKIPSRRPYLKERVLIEPKTEPTEELVVAIKESYEKLNEPPKRDVRVYGPTVKAVKANFPHQTPETLAAGFDSRMRGVDYGMDDPRTVYSAWLHGLPNKLVTWLKAAKPKIDVISWIQNQTPMVKAIMKKIHEMVINDPLTPISFETLAFEKTNEKYIVALAGEERKKNLRMIGSCAHIANYYLGPYIAAIQHSLFESSRNWRNSPENVFYMTCGMNFVEIGELITYFINQGFCVAFWSKDLSKCDKRICSNAMKLEHRLYSIVFPPDDNVKKCLNGQLETKIRLKKARKFTETVTGVRKSGTPNTTLGNSLLNAIAAWRVLSELGYEDDSFRLLVAGDDMVVFFNKTPPKPETYCQIETAKFGFVSKIQVNSHIAEVDFLSARLIPLASGGLLLTPCYGKCIPKLFVTLSKLDPNDLFYSVSEAMLALWGADPYMFDFFTATMTTAAKNGGKRVVLEQGDIGMLYFLLTHSCIKNTTQMKVEENELREFNMIRYFADIHEDLKALTSVFKSAQNQCVELPLDLRIVLRDYDLLDQSGIEKALKKVVTL